MRLTVGDKGETDARRRLSSCAPPNFNLKAEDALITQQVTSKQTAYDRAGKEHHAALRGIVGLVRILVNPTPCVSCWVCAGSRWPLRAVQGWPLHAVSAQHADELLPVQAWHGRRNGRSGLRSRHAGANSG